jgi:tetratricopeptide (TPR) repeat protein
MQIWRNALVSSLITVMVLSVSVSVSAPAATEQVTALLFKAQTATPVGAVEIANQILKIDPQNGDAYSILGCAKFAQEDYKGATEDLKKAVALKPQMRYYKRGAYSYLYHCYIQAKDWPSALKVCLESYKWDPSANVAHDIGVLYSKLGDQKQAQAYQAKSEALAKTKELEMKSKFALFKEARDPKKVDSVLKKMNADLARDPKNESTLSMRAFCFEQKHQYVKARNDLDTLITISPAEGSYYGRRSKIDKLLGDPKKSLADDKLAKANGFDEETLHKMMAVRVEELKKMRERITARSKELEKMKEKVDATAKAKGIPKN